MLKCCWLHGESLSTPPLLSLRPSFLPALVIPSYLPHKITTGDVPASRNSSLSWADVAASNTSLVPNWKAEHSATPSMPCQSTARARPTASCGLQQKSTRCCSVKHFRELERFEEGRGYLESCRISWSVWPASCKTYFLLLHHRTLLARVAPAVSLCFCLGCEVVLAARASG